MKIMPNLVRLGHVECHIIKPQLVTTVLNFLKLVKTVVGNYSFEFLFRPFPIRFLHFPDWLSSLQAFVLPFKVSFFPLGFHPSRCILGSNSNFGSRCQVRFMNFSVNCKFYFIFFCKFVWFVVADLFGFCLVKTCLILF